VVVFAIISLIAVSIGVAATLPSALSFLRSGGWRHVRRHVFGSLIASALVVTAVVPLSLWADHLNEFQRNGGDGAYSWAFSACALLVTLALVSWTTTAVAFAKRLTLSRAVLRIEGSMAFLVAASMAVVTGATAVWWDTLARNASWFLQGGPVGQPSSSVSLTMVGIVSVMSIAVFCAIAGVVRITGSWRQCSVRALAGGGVED
jgi:hypothetical protein